MTQEVSQVPAVERSKLCSWKRLFHSLPLIKAWEVPAFCADNFPVLIKDLAGVEDYSFHPLAWTQIFYVLYAGQRNMEVIKKVINLTESLMGGQ